MIKIYKNVINRKI